VKVARPGFGDGSGVGPERRAVDSHPCAESEASGEIVFRAMRGGGRLHATARHGTAWMWTKRVQRLRCACLVSRG